MPDLRYPSTNYDGIQLIDLNAEAERARLSGPGLQGFFNIMACWSISDEDAEALLGGITNGQYRESGDGSTNLLDVDVLTRISRLVGIFKALNFLYGRKIADEWVHLPNSNSLFANRSPLNYMIRGGIPAIRSVQRLLDARLGGS